MHVALEPVERIVARIRTVRGHRILFDADLASLYGVSTKQFNQAVKRNASRFPAEFMFRLTIEEFDALRSQIVTAKVGRGGRRTPPQAFTEHGALMAATILSGARAVEISVYVVRAFIQLRDAVAASQELAHRLNELEARIDARLMDHGAAIAEVLAAIRRLINPPDPPRRRIGF